MSSDCILGVNTVPVEVRRMWTSAQACGRRSIFVLLSLDFFGVG